MSAVKRKKLGNFNPRSPCGERPPASKPNLVVLDFNPRSPCGERLSNNRLYPCRRRFQSTLPMRGATRYLSPFYVNQHISIHAPHAGSDKGIHYRCQCDYNFNPRSPCGERRGQRQRKIRKPEFQSTLPMRGATSWSQ